MADERRYVDEEVAKIFESAATPAESRPRTASSADGLTLRELQAIGAEVGVSADRIAQAAAGLDLRPRERTRKHFGLPVAVGRSIKLPRALSDREWEVLLGELRRTFNAQGRDNSAGSLRAWSNGNLHANVERDETGYSFRIGTMKGGSVESNLLGAAGVLATPFVFFTDISLGIISVMGAAALAFNAVRLPRWAKERERQMEYIAARVQAVLGRAEPSVPELPGPE